MFNLSFNPIKPLGVLLLSLQLITPVRGEEVQAEETLCLADLPAAIDNIKDREEWARSRFGISVQTLDGTQNLYSHNSDQYFIPASTAKLLTTAAILSQLGGDYNIITPIYTVGEAPTLETLHIVGKGDPSLTTEDFTILAKELKAQGITEIAELIVEDAYFPNPAISPSWEWSDLYYYYGVAVNSAILNENAFVLTLTPQNEAEPVRTTWTDTVAARQWRIENTAITTASENPASLTLQGEFGEPVLKIAGELAVNAGENVRGLAVRDPGTYFLETLRRSLLLEGITVNLSNLTTTATPSGEETTIIRSPNLTDLIKKTNSESNNLYAEALFRTLGKESNLDPAEAMKTRLTTLNIDPNSYMLRDGSGLSRHNLVTPNALVQTLQAMSASPQAETFRNSLPVAGVSGTLQRRFQDTVGEGRVTAKTGTMTGASGLAGYIEPLNYEPLVFTILVNQSEHWASMQREATDEIVNLLARVEECEN